MVEEIGILFPHSAHYGRAERHCDVVGGHLILRLKLDQLVQKFEAKLNRAVVERATHLNLLKQVSDTVKLILSV